MATSTLACCPTCHDLQTIDPKQNEKDPGPLRRRRHLGDLATIQSRAHNGCQYCKLLYEGILSILPDLKESHSESMWIKPLKGFPLRLGFELEQLNQSDARLKRFDLEFYTLPGT